MGATVYALGTGVCANGYLPNTDRQPPGFFIDVDGVLILFDCSEGIRYRIQDIGYDYGDVQHVAVSHAHPDHAALPQFLQARSCRRIFANDKPEFGLCTVYMPAELVEGFQKVWDWHVPENDGKYWPEFTPKFIPLSEGVPSVLPRTSPSRLIRWCTAMDATRPLPFVWKLRTVS